MKNKIQPLLLVSVLLFAMSCNRKEELKLDLQVATRPVAQLTAFSVKSGGNISGTEPLKERGICWGTNENPTVEDAIVTDVDPVAGEYNAKITKLNPATKYHVRAYAKTLSGKVIYGDDVSFTTKQAEPMPESNSYMAEWDDAVVIPVARANKSALGNQIGASEVLQAELIWMDNADVIDTVFTRGTGSSGNIVVLTGGVAGNAVVAVKVNNAVKWSWHIWVTENIAAIGTVTMPSGAKLMDRNLGAISKTIGEIGAVGVQYQFGRKDPFTASASFGTPSDMLLYDLQGNNPTIQIEEAPKSLAYVTANPHSFIGKKWIDWCDESVGTWWKNDDGSKTVYDPCPTGWRMPALEDYAGLADEHFDKTVEGGHNFIYNNQSNYFPFTGYREITGIMDATAGFGTFWVNSPIAGEAGIGAALSPSYGIGGTAAVNGAPKARALSVRCVKE